MTLTLELVGLMLPSEWLQVGSLQEGAHPGAGEVAGDQHGGTRWDLLSSQQ